RHGFDVDVTQTASSGDKTASLGSPYYTGARFTTEARANNGGTGTTLGAAYTSVFGFNSYARLRGTATDFLEAVSYEADVSAATGTSTYRKVGIQIVEDSVDAVAGSVVDAGLVIVNQVGTSPGWV